jgi:hypothetical protein
MFGAAMSTEWLATHFGSLQSGRNFVFLDFGARFGALFLKN